MSQLETLKFWISSNFVHAVPLSFSLFDFTLISTKPINASTQWCNKGEKTEHHLHFAFPFSQGAKLCYLCKSISPLFLLSAPVISPIWQWSSSAWGQLILAGIWWWAFKAAPSWAGGLQFLALFIWGKIKVEEESLLSPLVHWCRKC